MTLDILPTLDGPDEFGKELARHSSIVEVKGGCTPPDSGASGKPSASECDERVPTSVTRKVPLEPHYDESYASVERAH